MLKDQIDDNEVLFRRVPSDKNLLKELPDGTFRISSQAFSDRASRPSVDRAKLRKDDPKQTLRTDSDGVVSVVTRDIRAIEDFVEIYKTSGLIEIFSADVEPKPIVNDPDEPDNPAHAEIFINPSGYPKRFFKKLCERLALLANNRLWEIKPLNLRNESS